MAGPQLIGIQPNEGELIVDGTVLHIAPRQLTMRFDDSQQIDAATLAGIQITRGGQDKVLGTADDVVVSPGLISLGEQSSSQVVIRFNETLPDDRYQIRVMRSTMRLGGLSRFVTRLARLFRLPPPGREVSRLILRCSLALWSKRLCHSR